MLPERRIRIVGSGAPCVCTPIGPVRTAVVRLNDFPVLRKEVLRPITNVCTEGFQRASGKPFGASADANPCCARRHTPSGIPKGERKDPVAQSSRVALPLTRSLRSSPAGRSRLRRGAHRAHAPLWCLWCIRRCKPPAVPVGTEKCYLKKGRGCTTCSSSGLNFPRGRSASIMARWMAKWP
jgi:hypothetical protein